MIGSHNSFTYLPPRRIWFKPFTFIWRCQDKNINEQKEIGVNYLDVRVRWDKRYECWRLAHGIVDLGNFKYKTLYDVVNVINTLDCKYRLILERGNSDVKNKFIQDFNAICPMDLLDCDKVIIKKSWSIIHTHKGSNIINCIDYSYVPFHTGNDLKGKSKLNISTIKNWARKHNPKILKSMNKSKSTLYFMDYVGINNKN